MTGPSCTRHGAPVRLRSGGSMLRRYRFEPLLSASGLTRSRFAAGVGLPGANLARYEADGLDVWQADRAACRLGLHPAQVWPDWTDLDDRGPR